MSTKLRGPSYCVHTVRNQAYVRLNGDMIYLGEPGSRESKEKYNRLIAEWLAAGRMHLPARRQGEISVNEVLLAYRRYAETYYVNPDGTPSAELERVNLAITPIMELYGTSATENFGPKALKIVRDKLVADGLCRLTINQRIGCVKRAFGWAAEEELILASIFYGLKAVKGLRRDKTTAPESREVKPVPRHITDAVLKFLPPTVQSMLKVHDLTGMRSGELVSMRTCDIELAEDGKPWIYRPSKHKTMNHGHHRVVPIGPQAQAVLRSFLKPDVHAYIFSPQQARAERNAEKRSKRKTKVQPSQFSRKRTRPAKHPGDRYTSASYRRALEYATEQAIKAGVLPEGTHWHPHQLRHNCATRIRKQYGLDAVRAILGHHTIVQSAEFAELDAELATATAAAVG